MRLAGTSFGRKALIVFAIGGWLFAPPDPAGAQFFDGQGAPRPPVEVPMPPAMPPPNNLAPTRPAARRDRMAPPPGPVLQSLPPTIVSPALPAQAAPAVPAGQAALALSA